MSDGRFTLGVGAGENLNEHVVGAWPHVRQRHDMFEEALQIMRALFDGETVTASCFRGCAAEPGHTVACADLGTRARSMVCATQNTMNSSATTISSQKRETTPEARSTAMAAVTTTMPTAIST